MGNWVIHKMGNSFGNTFWDQTEKKLFFKEGFEPFVHC